MATPNRVTKEDLIASAQRCIQEKGLDKLTFKAVAQGAGVTQGTVYYHFKTKEQLMLEIVQSICTDSWQEVDTHQNTRNPEEAIVHVLERARDRCNEKSFHTLFFSLVVHSLQNPALRDQLNEMLERENSHAALLLARLFPAEKTSSSHSLKYRAVMANALVDGLALQALLNPNFPTEEVYSELITSALAIVSNPTDKDA
ncbi:TetR/AcrR family transcriptional regulator [Paenibacillus farraposensis]|uniref:TetR/AcrR family transcriptional regulator n=1 Tax=Paenibacillus farraposensis TaxID=2807095 RepID=A0ABW4DEJ3_9BACL|nr:TetR/AcrR family transcriptional regulator [Paenibacillus farraposensis]MCC3378427.1 TetR/AcrR family transcriptional regulator [Paenibacillus farraposensis]